MSDKVFLDTNILVYAIEVDGPQPAKAAIALGLARRTDICLSTQVLGEFYRAVTSPRRASPLTHEHAVSWVQLWKRHEIVGITVAHVDLALELAARFQIGYYDALILSAARASGASELISEDFAHGQDYGGIRAVNPFVSP